MEANLDITIAEAEAQERRLIEELTATRGALKALRKARSLLRGEVSDEKTPQRRKRSLLDDVEDLLRLKGELHVDQIVKELEQQNIPAQKQVLSSALARYHQRGKRFRRTGRNLYALV